MKGCRFALTVVAPLFFLVACDKSPRFEPPVTKTNPNPTQGYEITVELIDPPADIRSIAGEAHFGIPDVSCMHQPDPIAGYTPGSSYIKTFALTQVGANTYQGRIFLDWPIDEDYYGLGLCKWELDFASVNIDLGRYKQKPRLWGGQDFPSAGREWWCRKPDTRRIVDNCTSPSSSGAAVQERHDSYLVILSATRK
jgi:hypothetical protein